MAYHQLIHRLLIGPVPSIMLVALLLVTQYLFSLATQHSPTLSPYYTHLLWLNIIGIVVLTVLISFNLIHLYRQHRRSKLETSLTWRLLGRFALVSIIPLLVIYYFSSQFLSRGIDSWFDIHIEQALDDALMLSQSSIESFKKDLVTKVEANAQQFETHNNTLEIIQLLDEQRESNDYQEISLIDLSGRVIASSQTDPTKLLPETLPESILGLLRREEQFSKIEPDESGGIRFRIVVPVYNLNPNIPTRILQVLQPLPNRYARLADNIEAATVGFAKLEYLREPLKFSFILTLTLIVLMTITMVVWIAIFLSRRLSAPLRELALGTESIAKGNYDTQLQVTSDDEFGILTESFNDMAKQVKLAQRKTQSAKKHAEEEHTYLDTVLRHLSSGVMAFDKRLHLRTANQATETILRIKLEEAESSPIKDLEAKFQWLSPITEMVQSCTDQKLEVSEQELTLYGPSGRQVLLCRITPLPVHGWFGGGCVVVFDDITTLIKVQRNAAWGEVARRLAHEIKNPLTPIQLSAERIRSKYLNQLPIEQRATLDRSTRTITQQVESLMQMVNEFANYARPVEMNPIEVDLNELIGDVIELHRNSQQVVNYHLELDGSIPMLMLDTGRLRQIMNNLIINALDALENSDDPTITITTTLAGKGDGWVEISIQDNGPGIPDNLLDQVFEPYVTSKPKGTGLGLAIVTRIVEELGGVIRAYNNSLGAMMTIALPYRLLASIQEKPDQKGKQ